VAPFDYTAHLLVSCSIPAGMPVNTYNVVATVSGGYYTDTAEDALVVYDPSLGYATGGGWFYWPGTANPATGYPGDKTSVAFTMRYNRQGKQVQGNLLVIRHLPDDTVYRLKSNSLEGLSLGRSSNPLMGWASITGKGTYLAPGWLQPEGNYSFILYVEDRNQPGTGTDRVWLQVKDKQGKVVLALSLPTPATSNNVPILGGNLFVQH
jgi:hypothetical protein